MTIVYFLYYTREPHCSPIATHRKVFEFTSCFYAQNLRTVEPKQYRSAVSHYS